MSLESNTRIDSPDSLVDSSASNSSLFEIPMMAGVAQLQSNVSETASAVLPMVEIFDSTEGSRHESDKPGSSDGLGQSRRGGGAGEQADGVQYIPGDNLNTPRAQDPWAVQEGDYFLNRFTGEQSYTRLYANGNVESRSRTDANGVLQESEVHFPDGSSETVRLGALGYTRTTSRVEGDRLNVDVLAGDGSRSNYSYLRGPDGRPGALISSRSERADGSVEESTYENNRLRSRRLTNADGSTEVETRDADGVTKIVSRNADNSLLEARTIRTDNRGLRTSDIIDGNGVRRRETELPGDTAELHEAYRTRNPGAQFVRVDQFDPGDPTGARIARSSIYFTGNGSPPGDILMTERSFDSTGNLRESIDYIPLTGYSVRSYRGGEVVSSRLNPSYVHDRFAYGPRRGG